MQQYFESLSTSPVTILQSGNPIKALIIDDSTFDRRRLRRLLQDTDLPINLVEVSSISTLPQALDASHFDVIFIDYVLPRGDGIEALQLVRRHRKNNHCATIMLTGDDRSDVAVRALHNGCTDYIFKGDLTSGSLKERVLLAIRTEADQTIGPDLTSSDVNPQTEASRQERLEQLQPKLAEVIRDVRALLAEPQTEPQQLSHQLRRIEQRCLQMWAVLLEPAPSSDGKKITH